MLESTPYLLKSATWTDNLSPLLSTTGYCWKAVEMSAQQVGVPSTKKKTSFVCVQNHLSAEERLTRWKARLTDTRVQPVPLGEFIGGEGSYFLSRKKGDQGIFSFEGPILSLTRGRILGEKTPSSGYQPHPSDVSSLKDAQELHLTDFAKIATGFEDYILPPTLNRSAIATFLVDSTPGGMMRAVVTCLLATRVLPKAPTILPNWEQEGLSCETFNLRNTDGTTDENPIQKELQNPTTESNLADHSAGGNSEAEKQNISPSSNTPRVETTLTYGATRRYTILTNTCGTASTDSNEQTEGPGHTRPYVPHPRDLHVSRDSFYSGQTPRPIPNHGTTDRGLLRKPQELMKRQREDSHLLGKIQDLDNGGTGVGYLTDDDGLLWYAPPGSILHLAPPRSLVPGILAFVHTTYGHPGVARTIDLTQRKYHWT